MREIVYRENDNVCGGRYMSECRCQHEHMTPELVLLQSEVYLKVYRAAFNTERVKGLAFVRNAAVHVTFYTPHA